MATETNGVDVPIPTKTKYVAHATPPPDESVEFVEKLIAPPITLPLLRIADQMPEIYQRKDYLAEVSHVLTEVESPVFGIRVRQHSRRLSHVEETRCKAFHDLIISVGLKTKRAPCTYAGCKEIPISTISSADIVRRSV